MMNKFIYSLLLGLFSFSVEAAELTLTTDKTAMSEGDTLYLTLEYTGEDNAKPDFSTLQKDFSIVSNSVSSQVTIINGNLTQSKKWQLALSPLKTGKIVIKPIKIGNTISNYAEIDIKEMSNVAFVPDSRENTNSPYFQIEQSYSPQSVYVQQQLTFVIKIYDSIGLQNSNIYFENAANDWIITQLSNKPQITQGTINGKKANILTYYFAAFPQRSGSIPLPQAFFDGYYTKNTSFDFPDLSDSLFTFGLNLREVFGQKVPVKMRTNPQTIQVKPIPDGKSSLNWLPLKGLSISADSIDSQQLKVGNAFTRTLHLRAVGMQSSLLPQINLPDVEGLKQYPEKPTTMEKIINGQIVTDVTMHTVYIPTKAGEMILPPIEMEWFNVETNRFEKSILPEEKIIIHSSPEASLNNKESSVRFPEIPNSMVDTIKKEASVASNFNNFFSSNLFKTGLWIIFVIVLCCIFLFFIKKKKRHTDYASEVINLIRRADYKAAKPVIINWARQAYKSDNIQNFDMICAKIQDEEFTDLLKQLNALLYSDGDNQFNRTKFIEVFKKVDKMKKRVVSRNDILPKLYD